MNIRKATTQYEFFSLMHIRADVFMCEQNVDPLLEIDEEDNTCTHYILEDNDEIIATCRVIAHDDIWHLGRFAVMKKYRHKKYGKSLLSYIINIAKKANVHKLELGAQLHAVPFYEGCGFQGCGKTYEEANIMHQTMELYL